MLVQGKSSHLICEERVLLCDCCVSWMVDQEVERWSELVELALLEDHDLVAVSDGGVEPVSYHEDGLALVLSNLEEVLEDFRLGFAIDVRGRLVEEEDAGVVLVQHGLSQSKELNLPTGEDRRSIIKLDLVQARSLEHLLQLHVTHPKRATGLHELMIDSQQIVPDGIILVEVWILQNNIDALPQLLLG